MKILMLNRGFEYRHMDSIYRTLHQKYELEILSMVARRRTLQFQSDWREKELKFYNQIEMGTYWKNRIYTPWAEHPVDGYVEARRTKDYKAALIKLKPDIVVSYSLFLLPDWEDYDYLLAAKELKIPIVGFVTTWDHLTTKSVLQIMPDLLFCWNETHKQELIKYHGISEDSIFPVGPYPFENWLRPYKPQRKDKFHKKYGLNPNIDFVLYLCSSPTICPNEEEKIFDCAKRCSDSQFIVQNHPDKRVNLRGEVPNPRAIIVSPQTFQEKYDLYFYAESVHGINTSAFFEAALMGKKIWTIPEIPERESLHMKSVEFTREWLGVKEKLPSELVADIFERKFVV